MADGSFVVLVDYRFVWVQVEGSFVWAEMGEGRFVWVQLVVNAFSVGLEECRFVEVPGEDRSLWEP